MDKLLAMVELRLRAFHLPAQALASCRRGATAIEYGLLAAVLGVGLITVLESLRASLIGLPIEEITTAIAAVLS